MSDHAERPLRIVRHTAAGTISLNATGCPGTSGTLRLELLERSLTPWNPGDPAFLVRGDPARPAVALAECAWWRGDSIAFRVISPWVPLNRRTFRRYRVDVHAELLHDRRRIPASLLDVSMSGMRAIAVEHVSEVVVDVCVSVLGHSTCLPCDVLASEAVAGGWEIRLRYRDISAQSLMLLTTVLTQLHTLETHRPETLAA